MVVPPESKLFGREEEIKYLIDTINSTESSITYLLGEAGIGKSALLEEFYRRLTTGTRPRPHLLVGFYGRDQTLLGESLSPIYPFVSILENLVIWARETEMTNEKVKGIMTRVENALVDFANEKGSEMVGAIVHDIAKKFGLERTLEIVEPLIEKIRGSKTALTLALYYAHEHSNEPVVSYVGIIQSLLKQFENRSLLLVFDQFESVRKSSIDFLLNFIKLMLQHKSKLHVIVSFKVEEQKWSDTVASELFAYANKHFIELGAKPLELVGLSEESIGKWIKHARNVDLDLEKLLMIRKHSAGFPILLNEWIANTQTFNHMEIDRNRLCSFVCLRRERLNEEDDIMLNKMAVLAQLPFGFKELTQQSYQFREFGNYIGIEFDRYPRFIERLVDKGLFERTSDGYAWFRHELIQMCLEDRLRRDYLNIYQEYHSTAAKLYRKLLERDQNENGY